MFVIYDKQTTIIFKPFKTKEFKSIGAAKRQLNEFAKIYNTDMSGYAIADEITFHSTIEKTVKRKNLMSGLEYDEPINTPPYMSPACESYWSM
jgi:hypothetical protein